MFRLLLLSFLLLPYFVNLSVGQEQAEDFRWSAGFNTTTIPANTVEVFGERKFHRNFALGIYTGFTRGWNNRNMPNLKNESLDGFFVRPAFRMVTYTKENREFYYMELSLAVATFTHEATLEIDHFYGTFRRDLFFRDTGMGAAYTTGFIKNFSDRLAVVSGVSLRFFQDRTDELSLHAYQVPGLGRFNKGSISVSFPVIVKFRFHSKPGPFKMRAGDIPASE